MSLTKAQSPASFRDTAGFIFTCEGQLFRQVNQVGKEDYDLLISSGLYETLTKQGHLVSHQEVANTADAKAYKTIQPEKIPFISYPYEWCFSQLKDAALLTLEIQKTAIEHGMTLKDASAYNIQFRKGKPTMIDTLSFEKYVEGQLWQAYRQFCQHF
nr:SAM-dependent methyltransferase [Candidatus Gracilibacteria bacterium]